MTDRMLHIDPIACDGHGICADLFPERITLDDWGYPIVDPRPFTAELLPAARRAVHYCPVTALRLRKIVDAAAAAGRPSN